VLEKEEEGVLVTLVSLVVGEAEMMRVVVVV